MANSQPCPNESQLKALLDGRLPEAKANELAAHLEACEPCRQKLDLLAGQSDTIGHQVAALGEAPPQSDALDQVKARLKDRTIAETATQADSPAVPPSLAFLQASKNPRHLGKLGDYEILEVIGRGGMGIVLKARDPKLERLVAVKVLNPELASSGAARARFLREARSAAAVTHEHVVTIHAVHDLEEVPFLVMEYIVGVSLEDRIHRSGHLKVEEVLRIGMQAASGLAAAHAQGLVHRDIKPSNILLENGVERVKITDFGLARVVHEAQLTQTNSVIGTPQYMSPEQARGNHVDHRSDLFSLGCVLYAMCTGRSPFRAETPTGAIHRVCEDTARPIKETNPDTPEWLAEIIDRLLAKKPEDRFQTANEVAEVLGQYLAHVQQPSRVSLPFSRVQPAQASSWLASYWKVGVAAACLCAVSLVVAEWSRRISLLPDFPISTPEPPSHHLDDDGTGETADRYVSINLGTKATVDLTDDTRGSGSPFSAFGVGPHSLDGITFRVDDRCIQLGCDQSKALPDSVQNISIDRCAGILHFLHEVRGGSFSNGMIGYYTIHYDDGTCEMIPLIETERTKDLYDAPMLSKVVFSKIDDAGRHVSVYHTLWRNPRPGKRVEKIDVARMPRSNSSLTCLAITCDCFLPPPDSDATLLMNVHSGFEVTIKGDGQSITRRDVEGERLQLKPGIYGIEFTYPEANRVLRRGTIRLVSGETQSVSWGLWDALSSGQIPERSCLAELIGQNGAVTQIVFFHRSKKLAAACSDGGVYIWRQQGRSWDRRHVLRGHEGPVRTVAISDDDTLLATAGNDHRILLWNLANGSVQELPDAHSATIHSIAFSADDGSIASIDESGLAILWDANERTVTSRLKTVENNSWSDSEFRVAFSPDGTRLVTGGPEETIKLWDAETGQRIRELHGVSRRVADLAFSPDGSTIAAADTGGTKFWETDTGQLLWTVPSHGPFTDSVAISGDGKLVACGKSARVRLFELASRTEIVAFPAHWAKLESMAFCPWDPSILATAGSDRVIRLWDVPSFQATKQPEVRTLCSFLTWDEPFAVGHDRLAIIENRGSRSLHIRDRADFQLLGWVEISSPKLPWLKAVSCLPDAETFACVGMDGVLNLWRTNETHQKLRSCATRKLRSDNSQVAASADGRWIAASEAGKVLILNSKDLSPAGEVLLRNTEPFAITFSPEQPTLAVGTEDGSVILYDLDTHETRATLDHGAPEVRGLAFSKNGRILVSTGVNGTIKLWEIENIDSPKKIDCLDGGVDAVLSASFSPNGKWLVTSGGSLKKNLGTRGVIRIWEVSTGHKMYEYTTPICAYDAQFTDDSQLVVRAESKTIVWDVSEVLEASASPE